MPRWERRAAAASHFLLYAAMLALPLSGWVINSAAGVPFSIYWLVPLPAIVPADRHVASVAAIAHMVIGILLVALLVAHVGAALRHHFIQRDDVLARMLPRRRKRGS